MSEVTISGDGRFPERQSKGSGKGCKNGSRTFYLGAAWSFYSELFETVVLQADVVLDCGATETAGGVQAVQILVDAVTEGFLGSPVEVDTLDRPWFRFANGHWSRPVSRVWLLTPLGWISVYTLKAENVPVLAGMHLLENHDISVRRNEFQVYHAEGHVRSVPLRRSPGYRILNLLLQGQRTASCLSHATAGDFSEDWRQLYLNVSSAFMFGLSRHPVSRFCQHANPALVNSHRTWSIPVSTQSDFAVFPHENVCQPSSLHSKLRSIKTRLNWLQTVIDGQKSRRTLDEMSKSPQITIGRELLRTMVGILAAGLRQNLVEDSMSWNRVTLRTNMERGSVVQDVPFANTTFLNTLLE